MAVKDCDAISNIIATSIIAWDDELSKEIARLSLEKRNALSRARNLKSEEDIDLVSGKAAHELELKAASADIQLRAIAQAKILSWEGGEAFANGAYEALAKEIKKEGWTTLAWGIDLLEKVRNAPIADYWEVARLWWNENVAEALTEIKNQISNFVASNYSIKQYSEFVNDWAAKLKKQFKNGEITEDDLKKELKELHANAMKAIDEWKNPSGYVKLDEEWQAIKKIAPDNPELQKQMWSQYVMARELLADGGISDGVLNVFKDVIKAEDLAWDLTFDTLAKYWPNDLNKLLARAYVNTKQLCNDSILRQAYREKLISLTSWINVTPDNYIRVNSIINTLKFAEQGATFSDVLKYDNLWNKAKKRGLDLSKSSQKKLYNGLRKFAEEVSEDADKIPAKLEIGWVEMKPIDAIQLIYDATWDKNIVKLINIGQIDDWTILDIATQYFLWNNDKAARKIVAILSKAKETSTIWNVRDLALKTTTGVDIKEWAPIVFFDFRKGLYDQNELNRTRANFMEASANKNRINIASDVKDITADGSSVEKLVSALEAYRWGYIVTNDVRRKENEIFRQAIKEANKGLDADSSRFINVIFPNRAMSANFTMQDEQLIFRTVDDQLYTDVSWTLAIQTLWQATPTEELRALAKEATTWTDFQWNKVNALEASDKYTDKLEDYALEYFWAMLWVSWKTVDSTYVQRVQTLLSEKTWVDIKAFSTIKDKDKLWAKIDKKFALAKLSAWKYDSQIADIWAIVRDIQGLTPEALATSIKKDLWDIIDINTIRNSDSIDAIRESYINYKIAETPVDSMSAKWRIISLMNWWSAETLTINDIKNLFQSPSTMADTYKRMFFANQEVKEKDMARFINQINDGIFNSLSAGFAENLVDAWYNLPLLNVKSLVYDYLTDNLDLNSKFVQALFVKNNIPVNRDSLNTLLSSLMPQEFKFGYEEALYQWAKFSPDIWAERAVVMEVENQFLEDSYSALWAIEQAKKWDLPIWHERQILDSILTKYYNTFKEKLTKWITFEEAEGIKQEASYALDMFEQDFLMSRYGKFLSTRERQALMWMKYSLPIWVTWQNPTDVLKEIENVKTRLLKRYDNTLKDVARDNDINAAVLWKVKSDSARMDKAIEERRKLLMEQWAVIREVGWQYVVYDSKKALQEVLDNLPKDITGLEGIKALGADGIKNLSNPQVYALLRYIEAAKSLANTANFVPELMYKQNPMLLKHTFFTSFKVNSDGIPEALAGNALAKQGPLQWLTNSSIKDMDMKKGIFQGIKNEFKKNWYVTVQSLKKIIDKVVEENASNFIWILHLSPANEAKAIASVKSIYRRAFTPYTYLRDLPSWWAIEFKEWVKEIKNIKEKVATIMKQQYETATADLRKMGYTDLDNMQDIIQIRLASGENVSLRKLAWSSVDSWKKDIFGDENMFVKSADLERSFPAKTGSEKDIKKAAAAELEYRDSVANSYNSALQSMMNETQIVEWAENKLLTSFMYDVRTDLRKYNLTNMIVDAADATAGLNEEAARWIKDYLIWFKGQLTFGKFGSKAMMERYEAVKIAYREYYNLDLARLWNVKTSTKAEKLALDLAKYFKTLEKQLWSADGLTGCTTKQEINRAFYHIGETFLNLADTKGLFWMLSAIEQNQILKFFKFSKKGDLSYVEQFIRKGSHDTWGLWWYRDYVTDINWITQREFNDIFATAYDEDSFKRVLQGLTWFTLTGSRWRTAQVILNFANWSNMIARLLMSYPWQLLTIPQQSIAYFLKQKWFERNLWMESLSDIDVVRSNYQILNWAYNELSITWKSAVNPDDMNLNNFYNRYWVPDIDRIYRNTSIETTDTYLDMYAKIDDYAASNAWSLAWRQRQLDPYKDNANNIIDGLFARNFKNVAFAKALKENDFLQFSSARAFQEFMDNPEISAAVKNRLMQRVQAYSGRNFRNILWLGFWWLDRPVAWWGFWNIMYWLMQLMNFRWAWWQNIFKQSWQNLGTMLKMVFWSWHNAWSREGRDAIAKFVATQPEFLNFVWAVFNDVMWTWKLQRFQDNGQWTWETEYDALDFLNYFTDTLNMTSQWYQGLQSFWPYRPIQEMWESQLAHALNPTIYKDTYWVWALFNAIGKNVWRQWKPYNWAAKAIWALTTDGWAWFEAYVQNEFWKLSFWSLRYMVNEDMNAYGYTYEMTWQVWGIPSIIMWEAPLWSDKNFSYELDNNETWETMMQLADGNVSWDDKWTYLGNLWKTIINGSQLLSLKKNIDKAITRRAQSYFTADDLADVIQSTSAGMEFYREGKVTPSTPEEARLFIDNILKNWKYRPWSKSFTKSIMQFNEYWHMNGKETWNAADAEMELWLEHMKHVTDSKWNIVSKNWKPEVSKDWEDLMKNIETYAYDQTYTTNLIYAYSKAWLDNHSSDPNYQLYIKMLGQWSAVNLIEAQLDKEIEYRNASAWKGADNKWTETEFKDVWLYDKMLLSMWNKYIPWENVTFFDKLQVLDTDTSSITALEIIKWQIKDEADKKVIERFYNVKENDDWSRTLTLNSQYESILTQIWAMGRALADGNYERFIAEASTLTHQFKNDDPTGMVTASLIGSIYERIYDTDSLSPLQKQEAMIALFHDNREFIERGADKLRTLLWDDFDVYADAMNNMLHQWDWQLISNLESIISSWDKSASNARWKAEKLSNSFKNIQLWLWWTNYSKTKYKTNKNNYWDWVPVTIKWASLVKELWLKGYTPEKVKLSIDAYKPHIDLSIKKDTSRKIKTTKTQEVSSKKQLSKIEAKVEKAIEAES